MRRETGSWPGMLLIAGSAFAYSLSGYFTRLIEQDVWTVLFWRGVFGGLFIGAFVAWRQRSGLLDSVRALRGPGLLVTLLSALATICFINALRLAPVAEVMTIHAAIPFLTVVLASAFVGEKEGCTTWAACLVAMIGVAVMLDPGASGNRLAGYGFASAMALSYAAMMVIIRQNRHVSMLPAASLSAFLCATVVLPFASPFAVTTCGLASLAMFGVVQFGLGLLLMTLGTRLISATSSALIGSMENPLAPLWVWFAFNEKPTFNAWIGGGIVMLAVIGDVGLRSRRREPLLSA